jgi:SAM-dependent methyltransferase
MSRSPFEDAALYDWEYRRRRDDVRFYRNLAAERGGPILDLGCGTGRLAIPLVRDGHVVVGLDRADSMLARAAARRARLAAPLRGRVQLVRGDLGRLPVARGGRFAFAVAAFHTVQHLHTDAAIVGFFREVRAALVPGGWLAFDIFAPEERFLARAAGRRWDRTLFRHPVTGQRLAYSMSHCLIRAAGGAPVLAMTFHYQPVDARGRPRGRSRSVRLEHRLLPPVEVERLLRRAGLALIASWGGFDGRPLARDNTDNTDDTHDANDAGGGENEQHVHLAKRVS